jgi:HEAT repeat protein
MAFIKKHTSQETQDLPLFSTLQEAVNHFETHDNQDCQDYVVEEIAKFPGGANYLISFIEDEHVSKSVSTKIASIISTLMPDDELIEKTMDLLKVNNAYVRNLGISILKNFGDAIKYYIVKFLIGDDRDLRIFAINVLGDVNFYESRLMLLELLENEKDINVAMTAVDYLGEIGEPSDIPLLASLKERFADDVYVAFAVDNAIKSIEG